MKAKIRPANLPQARKNDLDKVARQYISEQIDEYSRDLKWKMTRRVVCSVALVLSDQYGFGEKRIRRAVEGITEILAGVSEDVYGKGEIDPAGVDKVADNMMAELLDRGIHIAFEGDPLYDSCEKIRERKKKIASDVAAYGSDQGN